MKKLVATLLLVVLVGTMAVVQAEEFGVQVIGGKNAVAEVLSLDDMKLGESYKISGYATIKPLSFCYADYFAQYNKGKNGDLSMGETSNKDGSIVYAEDTRNYSRRYYIINASWYDSGETADIAFLTMDFVNLGKGNKNFMEKATVKVVYDDDYEFGGWVRQINYDYFKRVYSYWQDEKHDGHAPGDNNVAYYINLLLNPDAEEAIPMMYTGHYVFGCYLPNEVIIGNEPLRMVITLDGNELTYNIRK